MSDPDQLSTANYVRAVLDDFGRAVYAQNVKAVLNVVTDDVMIVGSSAQEKVFGRDALEPFLGRIFSEVPPFGWEWDTWETCDAGSFAWFIVEGRYRAGDDTAPYRASGVCRRDEMGEWKLAMFHGATPDA